MRDFFTFKKMLMPFIIQIIFWLGSLICIAAGISIIIFKHSIASGISIIILSPIVLRLICEIIIVFFKINQTLKNIEEHIEQAIYAQPGTLTKPGNNNDKSSLFDLITANNPSTKSSEADNQAL